MIQKTTEEIKETAEYHRLHDKINFDSEKDPQYGYVKTIKPVSETEEIYTQTTDKEIDIKKVIDAFNQA